MIRMGTVWDRTVDVLQGRTAILASLGTLYVFLPNLVAAALAAWGGTDPTMKLVLGVAQIVVTVLLILGMLAITAVASDPGVTRERATALGVARLGPALGVIIVIALAATLLFAPAGILVAMSGAGLTPAGQLDMTGAREGMVAFGGLLGLVALIVGLVISAKLTPLMAVVVNERLGLRAVARSWRLTRGSTARLVGVILLYLIVLLVVLAAVSSITGIIARLILGPNADATVSFIVQVATAIVTTIATVVQAVFYARFYVAAVEREGEGGGAPRTA